MTRCRALRRPRAALVAALALSAAALSAGCSTVGYYARSVGGHLQIVADARPVAEWLADPHTPAPLKERLALSQRIRDFAVTALGEPDNQSYRRYVDLKRPAAVWNVVAAPELSLTLHTSCFLIVGCVGYRGYYDLASAEAFAAEQRAAGFETSVYPVPAYSTLGMVPFLVATALVLRDGGAMGDTRHGLTVTVVLLALASLHHHFVSAALPWMGSNRASIGLFALATVVVSAIVMRDAWSRRVLVAPSAARPSA